MYAYPLRMCAAWRQVSKETCPMGKWTSEFRARTLELKITKQFEELKKLEVPLEKRAYLTAIEVL